MDLGRRHPEGQVRGHQALPQEEPEGGPRGYAGPAGDGRPLGLHRPGLQARAGIPGPRQGIRGRDPFRRHHPLLRPGERSGSHAPLRRRDGGGPPRRPPVLPRYPGTGRAPLQRQIRRRRPRLRDGPPHVSQRPKGTFGPRLRRRRAGNAAPQHHHHQRDRTP